jgi:hypothetical protein
MVLSATAHSESGFADSERVPSAADTIRATYPKPGVFSNFFPSSLTSSGAIFIHSSSEFSVGLMIWPPPPAIGAAALIASVLGWRSTCQECARLLFSVASVSSLSVVET